MEGDKIRIPGTLLRSRFTKLAAQWDRVWQPGSLVQSICPIKSAAGYNIPLLARRTTLGIMAAGLFLWFEGSPSHAQVPRGAASRPALTPELLARLTSDFRSATDHKPLRETLFSIASAAQINVWLDRRVDPTQPVSLGAQTATPYEAIRKAADESGLAAAAVDNVVIVGRPAWVQSLVGVILNAPPSDKLNELSWPEPSTPQSIIAQIASSSSYALPHDLWPAMHWKQLEQTIALRLICAQFDRLPSGDLQSLEPLVAPEKVKSGYPLSLRTTFQQVLSRTDAKAMLLRDGEQLQIEASPAAHMKAIDAWIVKVRKSKPQNNKPLDIDRTRFTLKIENAPAEQVLMQLAARCNRQLVFDEGARERCLKLVTFEATDKSLRAICDILAEIVDVTLAWTDQTLTVTSRP